MLFFEIQALHTPDPGKGLCKCTLLCLYGGTHTVFSYAHHDVAGGQL